MFVYSEIEKNISFEMNNLRICPLNWGRSALEIEFEADRGSLTTKKGNKIQVFKQHQNSLRYYLYDLDTKLSIKKAKSFFNQFKLELSYNCFGFCFADSKYWISDPTLIIEEYYEEVEQNEAEIIVFMKYLGFGDNGEIRYKYSHAIKVLENGNVSFKPGIKPLVENVPFERAISNYNFNHKIYLKKI